MRRPPVKNTVCRSPPERICRRRSHQRQVFNMWRCKLLSGNQKFTSRMCVPKRMYCVVWLQVALTANGVSRGFAFVDMSTWQEAELGQERCNRALLSVQEIRVSFGMPCRPGACILQHKNAINIPFVSLFRYFIRQNVSARDFSSCGKSNLRYSLLHLFLLHTHVVFITCR